MVILKIVSRYTHNDHSGCPVYGRYGGTYGDMQYVTDPVNDVPASGQPLAQDAYGEESAIHLDEQQTQSIENVISSGVIPERKKLLL